MCDRVIMVDYITLDKLWIESPKIICFSSGMDMITFLYELDSNNGFLHGGFQVVA